ncbi:MAG: XRE family transcriptional regulator [Propionibacterium sp.]|nr:XRE family transcriptional regulator [Propionibacterium sp.]
MFSGQRLRLARELRGMTQSDLANQPAVEVTSAAISQFESRQARPREATVEQFAEALGCPVGFFAVTAMPSSRFDDDNERFDGYGHFRSLRSLTAKQRRESLAVTQLARDLIYALAQRIRFPEVAIPRITADPVQPDATDAAASEVRRGWGVPDGPIADVLLVAERNGLVGVRHQIATDAVSAYSVPFPERPVLVLREGRAKRDRDRFSTSHEIGHLVLHRPGSSLAPKDVERQADRFASAFLMPADDIRAELPGTLDWVRFIELKQRWMVSIASLMRRARDLGVMPEATYGQGVRTISARGWRTDEPADLGAPESPRLLAEAVRTAGVSAVELADETGWPVDLVAPVLASSGDRRKQLTI